MSEVNIAIARLICPSDPDSALALAEKVWNEAIIPIALNESIPIGARWKFGDWVQKTKGSSWRGRVVGFYITENTPIGYAVESFYEKGSVQVWPEAALGDWDPPA